MFTPLLATCCADGIFTPHWYNLVDYVNDEMTLAVAFVKAIAASVFYGPFANGLFLAGARTLRYGLKVKRKTRVRHIQNKLAFLCGMLVYEHANCISPQWYWW